MDDLLDMHEMLDLRDAMQERARRDERWPGDAVTSTPVSLMECPLLQVPEAYSVTCSPAGCSVVLAGAVVICTPTARMMPMKVDSFGSPVGPSAL